jgi:hypothetical protein
MGIPHKVSTITIITNGSENLPWLPTDSISSPSGGVDKTTIIQPIFQANRYTNICILKSCQLILDTTGSLGLVMLLASTQEAELKEMVNNFFIQAATSLWG